MKKKIISCIILCTVLSLTGFSQFDYRVHPEMSAVRLPPLPMTLDFAGEPVPLNNFDIMESLQRDMLVTCYMHSRTVLTLLATTRYLPVIEPILEKYGIPDDFKYLCMAESGLNPNARSAAGAAGLWQFMQAAAKENGLFVGTGVDERYHIEKSTEAACKYILDAKKRLGSWTLAAASYNIGVAGISTRLNKQGVENYYDMFLPEETMRYIYRILTFKLLVNDPALYGYIIDEQEYYGPFENYHEITVNDINIDWSQVAGKNGTTYKMLRELNPWIRDYTYNNSGKRTFTVKIPATGFRHRGKN